jgi:hypothetical protein
MATPAVQCLPDLRRASRGALRPLAVDPWRPVPDVLRVPAFKLGDPVTVFVDMEADDSAVHGCAR